MSKIKYNSKNKLTPEEDVLMREELRRRRERPSFPQRHPWLPLIIALVASVITIIKQLMN